MHFRVVLLNYCGAKMQKILSFLELQQETAQRSDKLAILRTLAALAAVLRDGVWSELSPGDSSARSKFNERVVANQSCNR